MHDGSVMRFRRLAADYEPTDRIGAMNFLQHRQALGEVVTGLLYVDPDAGDLHQALNTSAMPLNQMAEAALCPGQSVLDRLNASLR
jgi:2-oxoglutarate/2-oxoacid ferredoxin oxidoreductase subunit beta